MRKWNPARGAHIESQLNCRLERACHALSYNIDEKEKKKKKERAAAFRTKQTPTGEELGDKVFGCLNGIFQSEEFWTDFDLF